MNDPMLLIRAAQMNLSHAKKTFSNRAEQLVASGNPLWQFDGNSQSEYELIRAIRASAHIERPDSPTLNYDSDALISPFPHFEYRLTATKRFYVMSG